MPETIVPKAMNEKSSMEWQSISTAPKDGTEIILGYWDYCDGWYWFQTIGRWDKGWKSWRNWAANNLGKDFTHWHHCQKPPEIPYSDQTKPVFDGKSPNPKNGTDPTPGKESFSS